MIFAQKCHIAQNDMGKNGKNYKGENVFLFCLHHFGAS